MMPAAAAAAAAARETLCSVGRGVAVEGPEEKVRHYGPRVQELFPVTIPKPVVKKSPRRGVQSPNIATRFLL